MSIEKLKRAKMLIQECIDEYQGEESMDDENSMEDDADDSMNSDPTMDSGDKIKMAAALMKRNR